MGRAVGIGAWVSTGGERFVGPPICRMPRPCIMFPHEPSWVSEDAGAAEGSVGLGTGGVLSFGDLKRRKERLD